MELINYLSERFNNKIKEVDGSIQSAIWIDKENLKEILQTLKEEFNFKLLADLTAADYDEHMEVVYHLMNIENCDLLRVKVMLDKSHPEIDSVSEIWKAAIVQESEVFDMLGVKFNGHPDLKRILCPEDFNGYPLRKDFKLDNRLTR